MRLSMSSINSDLLKFPSSREEEEEEGDFLVWKSFPVIRCFQVAQKRLGSYYDGRLTV